MPMRPNPSREPPRLGRLLSFLLLGALDAAVLLLLLAATIAAPFAAGPLAARDAQCTYASLFPSAAGGVKGSHLEREQQKQPVLPHEELDKVHRSTSGATSVAATVAADDGRDCCTRTRSRKPWAAAALAASLQLLQGSSDFAAAAAAEVYRLWGISRAAAAAVAAAAADFVRRCKVAAGLLMEKLLLQPLRVRPTGPPLLIPSSVWLVPSLPVLLPSPHSPLQWLLDILPGLVLDVSFGPPARQPRGSSSSSSSRRRGPISSSPNSPAEIPLGLSYLLLLRWLLLLLLAAAYVAVSRCFAAAAVAAAEAQEEAAAAAAKHQNGSRTNPEVVLPSGDASADSGKSNNDSDGSNSSSSSYNGSGDPFNSLERQIRGAARKRQQTRLAAARAFRIFLLHFLFRCCFAAAVVSVAPLLLLASSSPTGAVAAASVAAASCMYASALRCRYTIRTAAVATAAAAASRQHRSRCCSETKSNRSSGSRIQPRKPLFPDLIKDEAAKDAKDINGVRCNDSNSRSIRRRRPKGKRGRSSKTDCSVAAADDFASRNAAGSSRCCGLLSSSSNSKEQTGASLSPGWRAAGSVVITAVAATAAAEVSLLPALLPLVVFINATLVAERERKHAAAAAAAEAAAALGFVAVPGSLRNGTSNSSSSNNCSRTGFHRSSDGNHNGSNSSNKSCSRMIIGVSGRCFRWLRSLGPLLLAAVAGVLFGAAVAATAELSAAVGVLPLPQLLRCIYTGLLQHLQRACTHLWQSIWIPAASLPQHLVQFLVPFLGLSSSAAASGAGRGSSNNHSKHMKATQLLLWQQEYAAASYWGPSAPRSVQAALLLLPGGSSFVALGPLLLLPVLLLLLLLLKQPRVSVFCAGFVKLFGRTCKTLWQRCIWRNAAAMSSGVLGSSTSRTKNENNSSNGKGDCSPAAIGDGARVLPLGCINGTVGGSSGTNGCNGNSTNSAKAVQFVPWCICFDLGGPWLAAALWLLLSLQQQQQQEHLKGAEELQRVQEILRNQQQALAPLLLPFGAAVAACGAAAASALLQQMLEEVEPCAEVYAAVRTAATVRAPEEVSPAVRDVLLLEAMRVSNGNSSNESCSSSASGSLSLSSSSSNSGSSGPRTIELLRGMSLRLPSHAVSAALELRRASFACVQETLCEAFKRSPTLRRVQRLAAKHKRAAQRMLTRRAAEAAVASLVLLLLFGTAFAAAIVRLAAACLLSPEGQALHALERLLLLHAAEMEAARDPAAARAAAAVPFVFHHLYDTALYPDRGEALPAVEPVVYKPWLAAAAAAPNSAAAATAAVAAAAKPLGTLPDLLQHLKPVLAVGKQQIPLKQQHAIARAACTRERLGSHRHYFLTAAEPQRQQWQQRQKCSIYVVSETVPESLSAFAAPPASRCSVSWGTPGVFLRTLASKSFTFVVTAIPPASFMHATNSSRSSSNRRYCLLFAAPGLSEIILDISPVLQLLKAPLAALPSRGSPRMQPRWQLLRRRERDAEKSLLLLSVSPRVFVYYWTEPRHLHKKRLRAAQ